MYYGGTQVYIKLNNVMKIYISFLCDSWYTLIAPCFPTQLFSTTMNRVSTMPGNAKSYTICGCVEKLCGKNWCHIFYFMFVKIWYVSTCAVAIGGESGANHVISHVRTVR